MNRTSVFLGLALWGVVIYLIPRDIFMQLLAGIGAIALIGVCVIIMRVILEPWDD